MSAAGWVITTLTSLGFVVAVMVALDLEKTKERYFRHYVDAMDQLAEMTAERDALAAAYAVERCNHGAAERVEARYAAEVGE